MKNSQGAQERQSRAQGSHDSQSDQPNTNNNGAEITLPDSSSISTSSNESKKVSRQDIELVQNLIERCLQLYMNRDEVVKTLLNRARIDPGFTTLVWQKLEEENADFFKAYYIRLKLKKQILLFNHLLEHQYHLMKYPLPHKVPLAPMQNGVHPMPVNNLPMGYPVLQQPPMAAAGQPHINPIGCGISSCHVVNGVPAPGNYHPMRVNSSNDTVMNGNGGGDQAPALPPSSAMSSVVSDMPVSPSSAVSSSHFPFSASDISGMGVDTSALDTAFTSDVANSVGLQLHDAGPGSSLRSLDQIQWNFSLSDFTADFSNLGDLGAIENYPGSPFLHSDSEILLDSPEHEDIVEEFFVDSVPEPPCSQSDEEKP